MSNKYPKGFSEFVIVNYEKLRNKTEVANRAIKAYNIHDIKPESVRSRVRKIINRACIEGENRPIKRLIFDIETSFVIGWFWRCGYNQNIGTHQIIHPKKIICICYKWYGENKVHHLKWDKDQDDAVMLRKFVKVLGEADEIVGHNIDKFDMKEFRTRCIKAGILMFPKYRTLDTLKKARSFFSFESNRLDYLGEFLGVGRKIETNKELWEDIVLRKDKTALKKMIDYCKQDVVLNEEVLTCMLPYIDHNTNFAVMKLKDKWHCPECTSDDVSLSHTDHTPMGYVKRHMKCHNCRKFFHVSNKTYLRFIGSKAPNPDDLK